MSHIKNDFLVLAQTLAKVDASFEPLVDTAATQLKFQKLLEQSLFSPAPEVFAEIHNPNPILFQQTALELNDNFAAIFSTLQRTATFLQHGISVALDFSDLRAARSVIKSSHLQSVGPIGFMELFAAAPQIHTPKTPLHFTLAIDHLDVETYLDYMRHAPQHVEFTVGITDAFAHALKYDGEVGLKHQRQSEDSRHVSAAILFKKLVSAITAGRVKRLIFTDNLRKLKMQSAMPVDTFLLPCGILAESGELVANGTLNLKNILTEWQGDPDAVHTILQNAVHFLDNLFERNFYFDEASRVITKNNRRLNLQLTHFESVVTSLYLQNEFRPFQKMIAGMIDAFFLELTKASARLAQTRGGMHAAIHQPNQKTRHAQLFAAPQIATGFTQEVADVFFAAIQKHTKIPAPVFLNSPQADSHEWRDLLLKAHGHNRVVVQFDQR